MQMKICKNPNGLIFPHFENEFGWVRIVPLAGCSSYYNIILDLGKIVVQLRNARNKCSYTLAKFMK